MKRTLIAVFMGLGAAGWATNAAALHGSATGHCDGANHVVTVSGWYDEAQDGGLIGLVFVREAIGFCAAPVTVPGEPLPLVQVAGDGPYPTYTTTATLPAPAEAAVYRYTPYAVRADGGLEPLVSNLAADNRTYALVACGEAPILRGTVIPDWDNLDWCGTCFAIDPCPGDCWSETVMVYLDGPTLESLAGEPAAGLLGAVVDVYGARTYCTMPVCVSHTLSGVVRAEDGACGPVPAEDSSWGGLKATYR
ncbi:MAG: hypothetical protein R6X35_14930 [Candidatus Krumholzibacteriia bacterium]